MSHFERSKKALPIIQALSKSLRRGQPKNQTRSNPTWQYCIGQARKHELTQRQNLKGAHELEHIGSVYNSYLCSTRRLHELQAEYSSQGDRTTEQAANIVGLTLPITYEEKQRKEKASDTPPKK